MRIEASNNRRGGTEDKEELGRRIRAMAGGACQGSVWILVVQYWLLADTQ